MPTTHSITDIFNNLVGFVGKLPGRIGAGVKGMWDGILSAFKSVINAVIRVWNNLGFTIGPVDLGPLGRFGPWTTNPLSSVLGTIMTWENVL